MSIEIYAIIFYLTIGASIGVCLSDVLGRYHLKKLKKIQQEQIEILKDLLRYKGVMSTELVTKVQGKLDDA